MSSQTHTQLKNSSDTDLILAYQKTSNRQYVAELYRRYAHLIYGTCLKYLKDRAESEDMVMHIFERLLELLKNPKYSIQNFNAWVFQLTRNECLSKRRTQERQAEKMEKWQNFEKNTTSHMENDGFLRLINETSTIETILQEALKELSVEQQNCIDLFFYQKKSYKEIVATTDYTLNQVKSHLQNGKRNLKRILESKLQSLQ